MCPAGEFKLPNQPREFWPKGIIWIDHVDELQFSSNYVFVISFSPFPTSHFFWLPFCCRRASGKPQLPDWTSHSCPVFDPKPRCWSLGTPKSAAFSVLGQVKTDVRSLPFPLHEKQYHDALLSPPLMPLEPSCTLPRKGDGRSDNMLAW